MNEEFCEIEGVKILKSIKSFYNPAQEFNRDISVLIINNFIANIDRPKILECMSATGLRGIRYSKELKSDSQIFLNDISKESVLEIEKNLLANEINNIPIYNEDCTVLLNRNVRKYNVIDVDPYGSCTNFIESAIKGVSHNGLICLTSTDSETLCTKREKCFMKYNTLIVKNNSCHEIALRALLSHVSRVAASLEAEIEPILCVSVDFYVRIFLKVKKSKSLARKNYENLSNYFICNCYFFKEVSFDSKDFNNICPICKTCMRISGPFWNKPLHDKSFLDQLELQNIKSKRVLGFINLIKTELNTFLYFPIDSLCKQVKCSVPPLRKITLALLNANYEVSLTHCRLSAIKTNAPVQLIYYLILFLNNKNIDREKFGEFEVSFEENEKVKAIFREDFYRKTLMSKMGPLSKAKQ